MKITENFLIKGLTNKPLKVVKGIVIHWVANPRSSAVNNRKYWENLASGVSAHYIIDLNGDILHCVPDSMMAYQVGCPRGYTKPALQRLSSYPNDCVVGIECTHLDWDGKMTSETYDSLVRLAAKLLKDHKLTVNDLWLHSEIVGKDYKDCHRWFTTTKPEDWTKFKSEVNVTMNPSPVHPAGQLTDRVVISNTAYWQAKNLVSEFEAKGFRCYGDPVHGYAAGETPKDIDGFRFILETDFQHANAVLMELKARGYTLATWETI